MEKSIIDYSIYKNYNYKNYKKVNILENFNYLFQINKITIKGKSVYNITHNQCACDFFHKKNINLREELIKFILKRMEILGIEPCIYIKWIEDTNGIKELPHNKITMNENNLLDIFTEHNQEAYYSIKRKNKMGGRFA
ncbi:MAG: hypothetical protein LBD13_02945 [Spirochaetaceae bacterium]|nr:hypothetical protein [Spirochaetaceae bacterium]